MPDRRIAVLLPCFNEAAAIEAVVHGFRAALPGAAIHVYDNNSTDRTAAIASAAGAVVRHERLQGKGHVIRRMFADVEADIYVLADGDGTYDARDAPAMVALLLADHLDMVTGTRVAAGDGAYRRFHRSGNRAITGLIRLLFGNRVTDILSGYRVFSRRFVKSFPALAGGFETETELTVHALELDLPITELPTAYRGRPPGSASKLRTYADGARILRMIARLVKEERPLMFFGTVGGAIMVVALVLGGSVTLQYLRTAHITRIPSAILAASMMVLAFQLLASGLVLDSVTRGRREARRLAYLAHRGPE